MSSVSTLNPLLFQYSLYRFIVESCAGRVRVEFAAGRVVLGAGAGRARVEKFFVRVTEC